MRKIKFLLMLLVMAFCLASCDAVTSLFGDDLEKSLKNSKPLSMETLDGLVKEPLLKEDMFDIGIANTKATVKENGQQYMELYAWQEKDVVYLGASSEDQTNVLYLDLGDLQDTYEEAIEELGLEYDMKPSEIYEIIMEEYSKELGLQGSVLDGLDIDKVLDVVNYEYEDFEKVEDGKYKLNNEALYAKLIATDLLEDMDEDDLVEALEDAEVELEIYVYCDGKHITDYEIIAEGEDESIEAKITFLYEKDDFIGIAVDFEAGEAALTLKMTSVENDFNVEFVMETSESDMEGKLQITDKIIVGELEVDGETLFEVELEYSIEDKVYSVSGDISISYVDIKIETDASIPSDVKSAADKAENLLNMM